MRGELEKYIVDTFHLVAFEVDRALCQKLLADLSPHSSAAVPL
jgi:hypothetical protein